MWAQADSDGNGYILLYLIIEHKKTIDSMEEQDAYITTQSGQKRRLETSNVWLLLINWKEGTTGW